MASHRYLVKIDAILSNERFGWYEAARPTSQQHQSLRHLNPLFKLKEAVFYFILVPSSQCFIDPSPEHCKPSLKGVPYPNMRQFARSMLVFQSGADTADLIDGMNLDEAWAEKHVDFDDLQVQGRAFTAALNAELRLHGLDELSTGVDYRRVWNRIVGTKERHIDASKKGRYKTRWRSIKNDTDPRTNDQDQ